MFALRGVSVLALLAAGGAAFGQAGTNTPVWITGESVLEGNAGTHPLRFRIALGNALATTTVTQTFTYQTVDGSAHAGEDYEARSGTVTLTPLQPSVTVEVPVFGDTVLEGNEQFRLMIPLGNVGQVTGVGTILDDDGPVVTPLTVIPIDAAVQEPAVGEVEARIGLRLSRPHQAAIDVMFEVTSGTATAGSDYIGPASGTVRFEPGEVLQQIPYRVLADNLAEPAEFAQLTLRMPTAAGNATLLPRPFARLTIYDRSTIPPPSGAAIVACRPFVRENEGVARLLVRRVGSIDNALTVAYASSNGSALAGSDYAAIQGSLSWTAGQSDVRVLEAPVLDDQIVEPAEFFQVSLALNSAGVVANANTARVVIMDNDALHLDDFSDACDSDAPGAPAE
jgi:chitinase